MKVRKTTVWAGAAILASGVMTMGAPAALADVDDDGVLIQAQEAGGDQGGDNGPFRF